MYEVTIQRIPTTIALTYNHKGSYVQINKAFAHLCGWLESHDLFPPDARLIAIYYDNPSIVPEAELRSCAGVVLPNEQVIDSPFKRAEVPGGTYAVLHYKGPYSGLGSAYQWLYGDWLPQSGKKQADSPGFEEYLNSPNETAPPDLLTNICVLLLEA